MKKIIKVAVLSVVIVISANLAYAEDNDGDVVKNVRFGLKVSPSLDWMKPDGKIISSNGIVPKIGGGLIIEFRLAKVASIQTGIQLDLMGGKVTYSNGGINVPGSNWVSYYYHNADDQIAKFNDVPDPNLYPLLSAQYTQYQINERQYKITYVTIPLTLKLKTKEIGIMTYFGQVGVNTSIRWKAKATDQVTSVTSGANETKSNIDITKDVNFLHETLNLGLGAEMNLSGSTSLQFGINYLLGFTNVVKGDSDYLLKRTNDPYGSNIYQLSSMPQKLKSNSLVLTVGLLF